MPIETLCILSRIFASICEEIMKTSIILGISPLMDDGFERRVPKETERKINGSCVGFVTWVTYKMLHCDKINERLMSSMEYQLCSKT